MFTFTDEKYFFDIKKTSVFPPSESQVIVAYVWISLRAKFIQQVPVQSNSFQHGPLVNSESHLCQIEVVVNLKGH